MKKFLSAVIAMASSAAFMLSAQTPSTIAEMVAANPDLAQDQVSTDTYMVVTKNYSGTVTSTLVTVLAAGPDLMFVRDNSQKIIAVQRPDGRPAFNSFYQPGNKIDSLVVRYKANYVTRGAELKPVPYSVFEGKEYTKTAQTQNLSYSQLMTGMMPNIVNAVDFSMYKMGKNKDYMNDVIEATWNPETGEFVYDYTNAGKTYTIGIKAKAMGIDCSAFKPVKCSVYAQGVIQPTDAGFDMYPTQVRQDLPVELTSISALLAQADKMDHNGESYNTFNITSKIKINAISDSKMFIQDATGAMYVKPKTSSIDFTSSGLKAGDIIDGISLVLYHSTQYGSDTYGVYTLPNMPAATGFEQVQYPLQTLESLRQNGAALDCRPVMLENVRVKSNSQWEGMAVNQTDFLPGFKFDTRKFYTIKAIYQDMNMGSLNVVAAEATGDVPAVVPVDVANVEELLEKGASLASTKISDQIYRITGKTRVVKNKNYMFIQDATAAAPVVALANSSIDNAPYGKGSMVSGLQLRVQNVNGMLQGYFDVDESTWPAAIEGENGLPEIVASADLDPSYEFRWISLKGITAAARSTFKHDALHIASAPTAAATVTCNANLGSNSISFTKNDIYNVTGVLYGRRGTNGVTQWQFYTSSWEKAASTQPIPAENIGALKQANASLNDGATSEQAYELGPVYVTLRTADKIFAQTGSDGMVFASAVASADLAGFNYTYGDVVNGLQGKVTRQGDNYTMLLDPMAYPASTMNLPFMISVEAIEPAQLATTKYVMVELTDAVVEQGAARAESLTVGGLTVVADGVLDADSESEPVSAGVYDLKGVSDGSNFYVYSAVKKSAVGIGSIEQSAADVEAIFDASGVRRGELAPGLNIVKLTDGTVRKVIVKK